MKLIGPLTMMTSQKSSTHTHSSILLQQTVTPFSFSGPNWEGRYPDATTSIQAKKWDIPLTEEGVVMEREDKRMEKTTLDGSRKVE